MRKRLFLPMIFLCALSVKAALGAVAEIDRIVAVVNNDVITASELRNEQHNVEQQFKEQGKQLPPQEILQKQILERLIIKAVQLQLADNSGIRVDDETLNKTITRIAEENRLTLGQFRDILQRDGYDFALFREDIRKEIIISRLRERQILSQINVTPQEVENAQAQTAQNDSDQEYHLAQILIAVPEAATPEVLASTKEKAQQVLDKLRQGADFAQTATAVSDGQQALEGGEIGWRKRGELPTLFAEVVPTMKPGEVTDLIRSPSGFHIVKLIETRAGERHMITQTRARHILIKPNELKNNQEIENLLSQIKGRAEAGESFADLAKQYSEDKASAAEGGSIGWVNPGDTVPSFEQTMNSTAPGKISAPFQSNFGWHIILVEERRDIDNTEEFRQNRAREFIRQRKIEEETEAWLKRLRDEAYVEYRL